MKVGSCFTGVGMFDYGLQQAGYEIAWQIEWDGWCRRVLTKHWPDVPKYSDIREVDANDLEPVDLLIGGFPCQPFSVAGKQKGEKDDRYLWPEMLRIIKGVKPTWIIGENVAGIVGMGEPVSIPQVESRTIAKGQEEDVYSAVLTQQETMLLQKICEELESVGYKVQPFVIPASAIGAPHGRARVWIVGNAKHDGLSAATVGRSIDQAGHDNTQGQDKTSKSEGAGRPGSHENVAYSESARTRENNRGLRQRPTRVGRGQGTEANVAYTTSAGLSVRRPARFTQTKEKRGTRVESESKRYSNWSTQPRLGRSINGLADRLDAVRWPAGLGQPQHVWEPPRVATGIKDRVNRLKALGNGGMWQIPFIIGSYIKELEP